MVMKIRTPKSANAKGGAKFEDAGLHPAMLENIKLCGYRTPTPIQAYSIPAVLTGNDLIAVAQTGMNYY